MKFLMELETIELPTGYEAHLTEYLLISSIVVGFPKPTPARVRLRNLSLKRRVGGVRRFGPAKVFVENVSEKSAELKMSPRKKGDSKTPKDVFNGLSTEEKPAQLRSVLLIARCSRLLQPVVRLTLVRTRAVYRQIPYW